jgi:hypothetical protein
MTDRTALHRFGESGRTEAAPKMVNLIVYQTVELATPRN